MLVSLLEMILSQDRRLSFAIEKWGSAIERAFWCLLQRKASRLGACSTIPATMKGLGQIDIRRFAIFCNFQKIETGIKRTSGSALRHDFIGSDRMDLRGCESREDLYERTFSAFVYASS